MYIRIDQGIQTYEDFEYWASDFQFYYSLPRPLSDYFIGQFRTQSEVISAVAPDFRVDPNTFPDFFESVVLDEYLVFDSDIYYFVFRKLPTGL